MIKQPTLEDTVLHAFDLAAEHSENKVTRQLVDLFKSAVLRKYKIVYDKELSQKKVRRENLEKAVDFCFADACVAYRQLPIEGVNDENKEEAIKKMKSKLGFLKEMVQGFLVNNGIMLVE